MHYTLFQDAAVVNWFGFHHLVTSLEHCMSFISCQLHSVWKWTTMMVHDEKLKAAWCCSEDRQTKTGKTPLHNGKWNASSTQHSHLWDQSICEMVASSSMLIDQVTTTMPIIQIGHWQKHGALEKSLTTENATWRQHGFNEKSNWHCLVHCHHCDQSNSMCKSFVRWSTLLTGIFLFLWSVETCCKNFRIWFALKCRMGMPNFGHWKWWQNQQSLSLCHCLNSKSKLSSHLHSREFFSQGAKHMSIWSMLQMWFLWQFCLDIFGHIIFLSSNMLMAISCGNFCVMQIPIQCLSQWKASQHWTDQHDNILLEFDWHSWLAHGTQSSRTHVTSPNSAPWLGRCYVKPRASKT